MYIVQYKCSYEKCDFHIALTGGKPIWNKHFPEEHRNLVSVTTFNRKYVEDYYSEMMCWGCRMIITIKHKGSGECPNCHTQEVFMQPGWACRACDFGVIQEIEGRTKWF